MYFDFLPSIKYDTKPVKYPFSESDYVVAKNFFKRYKIGETVFDSSVYYNKVAVRDGQRLDQIAESVYGNAEYDWVIALTNNMINPLYDLPMTESELRNHVESRYDNPYYDIHHYETISEDKQEELFGKVLIKGNLNVDESFYNRKEILTANVLPPTVASSETIPYPQTILFDANSLSNGDIVDLSPPNSIDFVSAIQKVVYNFAQFEDIRESPEYSNPAVLPEVIKFNQNVDSNDIGYFSGPVKDFTFVNTVSVYFAVELSPAPGDILHVDLIQPYGSFDLSTRLGSILSTDITAGGTAIQLDFTVPDTFKVPRAYIKFTYEPDGTSQRDEFAIAGYKLDGSIEVTRPLGYSVTQIDENNYVIDGEKWTRENNVWYKQTSKGHLFYVNGSPIEVNGNQISRPITEFEYEQNENEKKREIFILKSDYLERFVDDFRKASLYKKSSDYITSKLKKSGV